MALNANLSAGDIEGFIRDSNTGRYLPGVEIEVSGTGRSAVTKRDGSYRISDVPSGNYTVVFRFIGYDSVSGSVNVPASGSATLSMEIGLEFVELATFKVEGYREGRVLALQQKRTANNIMDIISADSVGSLPDRNVAEALARIPGISLDVDSGEGRFVSIRGIEPNFNNVTLDGVTLANPSVGGRQGRSMPLDVVGSGQVYQIEVIKTVTPDMDGNALGGTINIKSISAFDQPGEFLFGKLEIGDNSDVSGTLVDADLTWGNTFNDGKVGVALSLHYSDRPYISHEIQANFDEEGGKFFPSAFETNPAEGDRERRGLNYNIEFHPDDDTEFYIRGIYNTFTQDERQQEMQMNTRTDPIFVSPTVVEFTRMRFEQRDFKRSIKQTLFNITAGGSKKYDNLTVRSDVTYSFSEEDVPVIKSAQFRTGNIDLKPEDGEQRFQMEFSGLYINFDDGGFRTDRMEEFGLRRFREEDSLVQEDTWTPRIDFEWDVADFMGKRATIKTGAKFTSRDRFVNDNSQRPVNRSFNILDIAPPAANSGFSMYGGRYVYPSTLDVDKAFEFLNANRSQFEIDPVESQSNSIEDDYDVSEDILALYIMATIQTTEDLSIIAGVRFEDTDATLKAFEFQEGENGGWR
ncbi:MAG: TonB-dependent receptor [Verrucomicrobia bacterium]|nr:TonB-dependent receptor [Verrucomicrobiota bacterium]